MTSKLTAVSDQLSTESEARRTFETQLSTVQQELDTRVLECTKLSEKVETLQVRGGFRGGCQVRGGLGMAVR